MPRLADLLGFIKNKNKFDKITLFKWLISLGGKELFLMIEKFLKIAFLLLEIVKKLIEIINQLN
ncbi:hypothetical protein LZW17_04735 [Campylobacter coli]|nr:hypothetical protein [Campylobacter coli]